MSDPEQTVYPPVGCRVMVVDRSEAHAASGTVWLVCDGQCLIDLDDGDQWIVSDPNEICVIPGTEKSETHD